MCLSSAKLQTRRHGTVEGGEAGRGGGKINAARLFVSCFETKHSIYPNILGRVAQSPIKLTQD